MLAVEKANLPVAGVVAQSCVRFLVGPRPDINSLVEEDISFTHSTYFYRAGSGLNDQPLDSIMIMAMRRDIPKL